jgi:uncharacterized protein YggE
MSIKRIGVAAVAGLLLVSTLLSGCAPVAPVSAAQAGEALRTITVVGRGEVVSRPDVAHTNIGVEVTAATVAEAMEEAEERMLAVQNALTQAGVAQNDIQTSNFSINFERIASEPMPTRATDGKPAGFYRVSNMVQVNIRDLTQVGAVIDAAVTAGANNIWGVNFGLDDTADLEAQAREKATADARSRAETLAELHGVTLGTVVSVSEVVGNTPGPIYADTMMAKGLGGAGTPVEPGEVRFSTQLQVVYAIQ